MHVIRDFWMQGGPPSDYEEFPVPESDIPLQFHRSYLARIPRACLEQLVTETSRIALEGIRTKGCDVNRECQEYAADIYPMYVSAANVAGIAEADQLSLAEYQELATLIGRHCASSDIMHLATLGVFGIDPKVTVLQFIGKRGAELGDGPPGYCPAEFLEPLVCRGELTDGRREYYSLGESDDDTAPGPLQRIWRWFRAMFS